MRLLCTLLILSSIQAKLYRRLIQQSDIPEILKEFLSDSNGLCVYQIFDTNKYNQDQLKDKQFDFEKDYFDVRKIVDVLQGEKYF